MSDESLFDGHGVTITSSTLKTVEGTWAIRNLKTVSTKATPAGDKPAIGWPIAIAGMALLFWKWWAGVPLLLLGGWLAGKSKGSLQIKEGLVPKTVAKLEGPDAITTIEEMKVAVEKAMASH